MADVKNILNYDNSSRRCSAAVAGCGLQRAADHRPSRRVFIWQHQSKNPPLGHAPDPWKSGQIEPNQALAGENILTDVSCECLFPHQTPAARNPAKSGQIKLGYMGGPEYYSKRIKAIAPQKPQPTKPTPKTMVAPHQPIRS